MFKKKEANTKQSGFKLPNISLSPKKASSSKVKAVNKTLLAIDIGSKTSKIVVGKHRGNKIQIDLMNGAVNNKDTSFDGRLLDAISAQNSLKKLLISSKVEIKETVFTTESTGFIRREIDIPNVASEDVFNLVQFEIGDYLPIDTDSYVLQVKELGTFNDETGVKKKKVSVGAVPKNIAESYVNLCRDLRLEQYAMDVNSNALEKLISLEIQSNPNSQFRDRNVVFIDMGHSFFNISIFGNGKYLFNRMIETGGGMIDTAISHNMRIPVEEAEIVKLNNSKNFSILDLIYKLSREQGEDTVEIKVLKDTLSVYEQWSNEVNQILKYYTTRDRRNTIDEIYLYGGCSFVNGIDKYFQERFQLPTRNIVNFDCIQVNGQEGNRNILNYLNVIGALIRY